MERVLGHFHTRGDVATAKSRGKIAAYVVFAAIAAAALRLGVWLYLPIGVVNAYAVYAVVWRIALSRTKKGEVDVVDDPELGVVLAMKRERGGVKVPLAAAQLVGRTRKLAASGAVRMQIEVRCGEAKFACNLAVPFRPSDRDEEGVVPALYDLDRAASRALDALSYELAEENEGPSSDRPGL